VDRLLLEGMTFSGRHGVLASERTELQPFTVDVELAADLTRAGASDRLADTVDYTRAHAIVREVVEGEHRDLLEALAEQIAERLLSLEGVRAARVRVAKKPPLPGEFRAFAVEIERSR
jgi:7,8-dihydroneopterin aldolase/epimerase/oxygenase